MKMNKVICNNTNNNYKSNVKDSVFSQKTDKQNFSNVMNKTSKKDVDTNHKDNNKINNESIVVSENNKLENVDKDKCEEVLENLEVVQMLVENYYNDNNVDFDKDIVLDNIKNKTFNDIPSINENMSVIVKMLENSNTSKNINSKQLSKDLIINLQQLEKQLSNIGLLETNTSNLQEGQLTNIMNKLLSRVKNMVVTDKTVNVDSDIIDDKNALNIDITKLDNNLNSSELENAIKNSSLGKNIVTTENSEKNISDMVKVEGVLNNKDLNSDNSSVEKEIDNDEVDKSINLPLANKTLNKVNSEIKISHKSNEISSSVVNQVKDKIVFMSKQNINTVKMQLHPDDLGELDIKLLFEEGKLSVEILASNTKTQSLIASNLSELKDILKDSIDDNTLLNIDVKEETAKDYLQQNNQGNSRQQNENQEQDSYNDLENDLEKGIDYVSFQDEMNQLINDTYK